MKDNEVLENSRYALLKNEENRTEKQKEIFKAVMDSSLEVSKAHYAKESFKTLFDRFHDDHLVRQNFIDWANTFLSIISKN